LDQITKFFLLLLLSDAPSYWFTLNTSCDHAFFHLSKWLGMDDSNYKALLIAGNLARYKVGAFIIQADEWKSFLVGHHLFMVMDLPSDQHAFQFDRKWIALDDKRRTFYVIRIGRGDDLSPVKYESQLKMDRLPPQINSLRLQQQKFRRDTGLAIAHVQVDLFVGGAEDSLSDTAPSKSLAPPQMGLSDADATTKIVGVGISDVERQMYPLHLYFNSNNKEDLFVCSFNTPPPDSPPHTLLLQDHTTIEIGVFVTRAFQAMIPGREAMSGQHMLCQLSQKQFNQNKDKVGLPWTYDDLVRIGTEVCAERGGKSLLGVKQEPWWPFLDFKHLMVPLLHCLIGIGNNLINRFCDVVNEYVENLSAAEMKHARALTNPVVIAQTLKVDGASKHKFKSEMRDKEGIESLRERERHTKRFKALDDCDIIKQKMNTHLP
jgi:hypothetical protein